MWPGSSSHLPTGWGHAGVWPTKERGGRSKGMRGRVQWHRQVALASCDGCLWPCSLVTSDLPSADQRGSQCSCRTPPGNQTQHSGAAAFWPGLHHHHQHPHEGEVPPVLRLAVHMPCQNKKIHIKRETFLCLASTEMVYECSEPLTFYLTALCSFLPLLFLYFAWLFFLQKPFLTYKLLVQRSSFFVHLICMLIWL